MNKLLKFTILLLISSFSFSQDTLTFYYNNKWKKVENIKEASYYRKAVKIERKNWSVWDFYMNGTLQMEGYYTSDKFDVKNGKFKIYYRNGNLKYSGSYINNKEDGPWKSFYSTGKIYADINYLNGKFNGVCKYYYKNGNRYSIQNFELDSLNGTCEWFYYSGNISSREEYIKGVPKKIVFFTEDGQIIKGDHKVTSHTEFPGGTNAMRQYIADNINYPKKAKKNSIEGKVVINFKVNTEGNISETKIAESVHPLLDKEAERIILSFPKFKPAKQHNLLKNFWFSIPITFKINDNEKN